MTLDEFKQQLSEWTNISKMGRPIGFNLRWGNQHHQIVCVYGGIGSYREFAAETLGMLANPARYQQHEHSTIVATKYEMLGLTVTHFPSAMWKLLSHQNQYISERTIAFYRGTDEMLWKDFATNVIDFTSRSETESKAMGHFLAHVSYTNIWHSERSADAKMRVTF